MGIFDFFKSSEKKEKKYKENYMGGNNNQQQIRRQIYDIVNNESEIMENGNYDSYSDDFKEISYYDEFGKEFKMPKKDWIDKKLYPSIRKNWSNMEGLYPIIQDAFSKELYPEIKEAVLRFYAADENFERKLIMLGTYHIKTGSCESAVELYEKNLNINNVTEGLCIAYAEALEVCERLEESEKKYYEALEINPNSATAFKKYFDIVKKRSSKEYENKLEKLSEIKGNWRAKMMQAIVYFKKGDKESGNFFLITALKESGYNSEVMYITSSIYILNELYDEFKQYVLAYYNPEKHNVYTALNVLKYYKVKGMYKEGLELCKFTSKFPWIEHYKKFMHYEDYFWKLKVKKETGDVKENMANHFFSTNKPIWYYEFNHPEFMLNQSRRVKPNILILTLTSIGEKSELAENLAVSLPLYLNENLHYKTNLNYQLAIAYNNESLFVSKKRYSTDYMKLIRQQNNNLNFVLAGNILKMPNVEKYEIEIYLYDTFNEQKSSLINKIYDENTIYNVQNDLLKAVSGFFGRDFSIKYEKNMDNLILFSPKMKFLIQSKIHREHQSWRYKKLLSDQIDVVLEDRNNDLKKINLLALLCEIKQTNSQLLKFQKPLIYNMNIHGIFETQTLKILAPIIFRIYDDDVNFQANIEALNITDSNYLNWINKFMEE
ncbi:tetratricopeptide repeat protein [Leptotrichia sp. HSP-342]|uniref:Tetratricopeptide repeat protein n=1 Tax=Leptotrichia mesophila TaxID=3239303 RepID=A0AB39VEM9_9FUSO